MGVSQSETPDAPASFAMNRSGAAAEEEYTPEACEKELKSSTWNGGNYKHSAKPTYKYQSSKFKTLDPPPTTSLHRNPTTGKPVGGPESYDANPWRFDSNNRFVTERDGCNGRWQVRADASAPGGVMLRMDWEVCATGQRNPPCRPSRSFHPVC